MRLSAHQIATLDTLDEGAASPTAAMVHFGKQWQRTLGALERNGLVRYFPYGQDGEGSYRITREGRRWIHQWRLAHATPQQATSHQEETTHAPTEC